MTSALVAFAFVAALAACILSGIALRLLGKILRTSAGEQERERISSESLDKAVRDLRDDAERTRTALNGAISTFRVETTAENRSANVALQQALSEQSVATNKTLHERFESFTTMLSNASAAQTAAFDAFRTAQQRSATESRETVAASLEKLREENARKLEEMRGIVDKKLHTTLETRLGESFKLVSERLEKVNASIGEMRAVATDMSNLKNVLTNVKTRGTWGEFQLETLLSDILAPEQFERNVKPNPRRQNIVEFAIKLPGDDQTPQVWLPIDSKFPKEDYERLVDASRDGNAEEVKKLSAQICRTVESFARDIRERYISLPWTTNFAVLFLPTEGLFAEVLRAPGFAEKIQREQRVVIAGPTTLAALLNSLQVGFQTLKVQKNTAAIAKLLLDIRAQYDKVQASFEKLQTKLSEAQDAAADAEKRHRRINEKLQKTDALPAPEAE